MNPSHSSYVEYGTGRIQIKGTAPILGSGFLLGVKTHQIYSCPCLHDINHLTLIGNMLNIDAGTIKRKIDSNEYDDEIIQEAQVQSPLAHLAILKQAHPPSAFLFALIAHTNTHCHISADITPTHVAFVISRTLSCIFYFFLIFDRINTNFSLFFFGSDISPTESVRVATTTLPSLLHSDPPLIHPTDPSTIHNMEPSTDLPGPGPTLRHSCALPSTTLRDTPTTTPSMAS